MFYKDFGVQVSSAPDLYITLFSNIDPRLIICCRVIYFFCVNSNLIIIITLYRYLSFKEWRRYSEPSLVFRSEVSHFSHVNYIFLSPGRRNIRVGFHSSGSPQLSTTTGELLESRTRPTSFPQTGVLESNPTPDLVEI